MSSIKSFISADNKNEYIDKLCSLIYQNAGLELYLNNSYEYNQLIQVDRQVQKLKRAIDLAQNSYTVPDFYRRLEVSYFIALKSQATTSEIILALLLPAAINEEGSEKNESEGKFDEFISRRAINKYRADDSSAIDQRIFGYCCERMLKTIYKNLSTVKDAKQYNSHKNVINLTFENISDALKGEGSVDAALVKFKALSMAELLFVNGFDIDVILAALISDDKLESVAVESPNAETVKKVNEYLEIIRKSEDDIFSNRPRNQDEIKALHIKAAEYIIKVRTYIPKCDKVFNSEMMQSYSTIFYSLGMKRFSEFLSGELQKSENETLYHKQYSEYFKLLINSYADLDGYTCATDKTLKENGISKSIITYINNIFNVSRKRLEEKVLGEDAYCKTFPYTYSEIVQQLQSYYKANPTEKDNWTVNKKSVCLQKMYVVLSQKNERQTVSDFTNSLLPLFSSGLASCGLMINRAHHDYNDNSFHIIVSDKYCNRTEVVIIELSDYLKGNFGCAISAKSFSDTSGIKFNDDIIVHKRDGSDLIMKKGSTALDFAYYISHPLSLIAYDAIINNKRCELSTVLKENDNVYICKSPSDKPEYRDDDNTPKARIRYLKYTKDPEVQKYIIDYLAKKYDGDDVKSERFVVLETYKSKFENVFDGNLPKYLKRNLDTEV